jgi:hypothetical protein
LIEGFPKLLKVGPVVRAMVVTVAPSLVKRPLPPASRTE